MNIFEREITTEELNEKLKDSMETTHMINKHLPMRLYNMAKEEHNRQTLRSKIVDKLYKSKGRQVIDVIILDENSAIIKTLENLFSDEEKNWYHIYYNDKINSAVTDNFEHALIMLICARNKMLDNSDASRLIARMLGIEDSE